MTFHDISRGGRHRPFSSSPQRRGRADGGLGACRPPGGEGRRKILRTPSFGRAKTGDSLPSLAPAYGREDCEAAPEEGRFPRGGKYHVRKGFDGKGECRRLAAVTVLTPALQPRAIISAERLTMRGLRRAVAALLLLAFALPAVLAPGTAEAQDRPDRPSGVTATQVSPTQVDISWTANVPSDIDRYEIQHRRSGTDWNSDNIQSTLAAERVANYTYRIFGLTTGQTYEFRVRAIQDDLPTPNSYFSPCCGGTLTKRMLNVPLAPDLSGVLVDVTGQTLSFRWHAPAADAARAAVTGYRVQRSADGSTGWTAITPNLAADANPLFSEENVPRGTIRHYRVRALSAVGASPWSATVSGTVTGGTAPPPTQQPTPPPAQQPPGQVTGVMVSAGVGQLAVTWTVVTGATGYRVQWKSGGQDYNTGDRQATATGTSYTITGLTAGTPYTVRVTATNAAGAGTPSAEATGTPRAANMQPTAADDPATTPEDPDSAVPIDVLANDTDPDSGTTLIVASVTQPANGVVRIDADRGGVTYTPNPDFNGEDTFTYTADDQSGAANARATATVTVTVNPVADAPVAGDDSAATGIDTAVVIRVLDNDADADGDTLMLVSVTQPANGAAVADTGAGTVTYTPADGFSGRDSFTYEVSDGNLTDTATVRVTVRPPHVERMARANAAILPEAMRAVSAGTLRAVAGRIGRAVSGAPGGGTNLADSRALAGALAAWGRALEGGEATPARLLAAAPFALHAAEGEGGADDPLGSLAFWGAGDWRSLSGGDAPCWRASPCRCPPASSTIPSGRMEARRGGRGRAG